MLFAELASFDVCLNEQRLGISCRPGMPDSTRSHFLADQVVPRIYGQKGRFVLHAAGVVLSDSIALLLGKSGQGKSTLAGYLSSIGHNVIGDDAVMLRWEANQLMGEAVYPSLRMFPDSHQLLTKDYVTFPTAHYTRKVRVRSPRLVCGKYPVCGVFLLGTNSREPQLQKLPPAAAAMALLGETFVLDPTDIDLAKSRLEIAVAIAAKIPVFNLFYRRDYAMLPQVATLLVNRVLRL